MCFAVVTLRADLISAPEGHTRCLLGLPDAAWALKMHATLAQALWAA